MRRIVLVLCAVAAVTAAGAYAQQTSKPVSCHPGVVGGEQVSRCNQEAGQ